MNICGLFKSVFMATIIEEKKVITQKQHSKNVKKMQSMMDYRLRKGEYDKTTFLNSFIIYCHSNIPRWCRVGQTYAFDELQEMYYEFLQNYHQKLQANTHFIPKIEKYINGENKDTDASFLLQKRIHCIFVSEEFSDLGPVCTLPFEMAEGEFIQRKTDFEIKTIGDAIIAYKLVIHSIYIFQNNLSEETYFPSLILDDFNVYNLG